MEVGVPIKPNIRVLSPLHHHPLHLLSPVASLANTAINTEDLTPLSQVLIPPELASAFSITPEPCRTLIDVNRASQKTLSSLHKSNQGFVSSDFKSLPSFGEDRSGGRDSVVVEREEHEIEIESDEHDNEYKIGNEQKDGSEKRKSAMQQQEGMENLTEEGVDNFNDDQTARALKRPRLVWTPQLHKRFVDVVAHLGIT
ncbi:Transcription factor boa [Thalictrum thalictroides]|uniref:Transcription factor boa n=1 Tax=Thalictrum thalictroides TaxID=46969 RepID=A0A7J6UR36_THATH|nr:Transcription factor boa [Thalictrum thalictroides]